MIAREAKDRFRTSLRTLHDHCLFGQVSLRIMERLSQYLLKAKPDRWIAPIFLQTTFHAHRRVTLANLALLFDRHRSAMSFWKLLSFYEQNASALSSAPTAVPQFVRECREDLAEHDAELIALKHYRDKGLMHMDWDRCAAMPRQKIAPGLTWGTVRCLYQFAGQLWNAISAEVDRSTSAWELRGRPFNDETDVEDILEYGRCQWILKSLVKKKVLATVAAHRASALSERDRLMNEVAGLNALIDKPLFKLLGVAPNIRKV
jgi:hypothetical protein